MTAFLPGVPGEAVLAALRRSPGSELASGKFDSPESSAALVANGFGWFLERPGALPPLPGVPMGQPETVEIEAEALSIPESLTVSVEGVEAGTQITAGQIELPAGVSLVADPELLVVNIVAAPTAEELDAEGAGESEGAEAGGAAAEPAAEADAE